MDDLHRLTHPCADFSLHRNHREPSCWLGPQLSLVCQRDSPYSVKQSSSFPIDSVGSWSFVIARYARENVSRSNYSTCPFCKPIINRHLSQLVSYCTRYCAWNSASCEYIEHKVIHLDAKKQMLAAACLTYSSVLFCNRKRFPQW